MEKDSYKVIGVMSGTSVDGVDLAYVQLTKAEKWTFSILEAETIPYTAIWTEKLKTAIQVSEGQLRMMDMEYTFLLAEMINDFMRRRQIKEVDAICSHGHTIFHQPDKGITCQIGNSQYLADITGQTVVCDFRVQDVKLGGQGAPLVPIGDRLLFGSYDYCLNLGGFANVSTEVGSERIAFDICPANIVLNHYVASLGMEYDREGAMAASGTIDEKLLHQLNSLSFYSQAHPKSLGLEWVKEEFLPLTEGAGIEIPDLLRTICEHIAIQIAKVVPAERKMLISGGGVYNTFLISRIKALTGAEMLIPEDTIVQFKEALVFALLGVLKLRDEVNCLKSVTGAVKDHSSGMVYSPKTS